MKDVRIVTDPSAPTLPPKPDSASETDYADPWKATETARREIYTADTFRADLHKVTGLRITSEIERDPAEVARLRAARSEGREEWASRRRAATKSSQQSKPDKT